MAKKAPAFKVPKGYEAGMPNIKVTHETNYYPKMKSMPVGKRPTKSKPYVQLVKVTNPGALKSKKR